jgi:hypothetical protein
VRKLQELEAQKDNAEIAEVARRIGRLIRGSVMKRVPKWNERRG